MECPQNRISAGERTAQKVLDVCGAKYEREKTYDGLNSHNGFPLKFDFFVYGPERNFLIEIDGQQHNVLSKRIQSRAFGKLQRSETDVAKNIYCLEHHIRLYRVPYIATLTPVSQSMRTILRREGIQTKTGGAIDDRLALKMIVADAEFCPFEDDELFALAVHRHGKLYNFQLKDRVKERT
jgi:hypothetical protein